MNFHDEFVKFSKNLSNSLSYLPERPTEMEDVPVEGSDKLATSEDDAMDSNLSSCPPSLLRRLVKSITQSRSGVQKKREDRFFCKTVSYLQ
jgi:hypothetical protein